MVLWSRLGPGLALPGGLGPWDPFTLIAVPYFDAFAPLVASIYPPERLARPP